MFNRIGWVVLALATAVGSSGCARFRVHNVYDNAKPGKPLEVPPDLTSPSTLGALTIPDANGSARAAEVGVPGLPSSALVTEVVIADDPASGFRRVGLALERSGVAQVLSKDESASSYKVHVGFTVVEEKPGFFRRMFSRGGGKTTSVDRVVRLVPAGGGSKVQIEDESGKVVDDESAHRLLAALKERLG